MALHRDMMRWALTSLLGVLLPAAAIAAEHTVVLDDSELSVVSEALVAQPYSKVWQLIAKLQQQLQAEREKQNAPKVSDSGDKPLVSGK